MDVGMVIIGGFSAIGGMLGYYIYKKIISGDIEEGVTKPRQVPAEYHSKYNDLD